MTLTKEMVFAVATKFALDRSVSDGQKKWLALRFAVMAEKLPSESKEKPCETDRE